MPTPDRPHPTPAWRRCARRLACGALAMASTTIFAQTGLAPASPSAPSPPASADNVPGRLRPTPKVSAPSDAQRSFNLANPQPEGRVTPQIRIPLGKKSDAPVLQRRPTDTTTTTTTPLTATRGPAASSPLLGRPASGP